MVSVSVEPDAKKVGIHSCWPLQESATCIDGLVFYPLPQSDCDRILLSRMENCPFGVHLSQQAPGRVYFLF